MKIEHSLFAMLLTFALTLPTFGQHEHEDKSTTDTKQQDMSKTMGRPKVDVTVDGLHLQVWLTTQKQHKKMMKEGMGGMMMSGHMGGMMGKMKDSGMEKPKDMDGMKHEGMDMDKATKEAMMSGSHHIMLDVTDATTGKGIANATAKIIIVSPSKNSSSVDLKPMMSHFGSGLALYEKGKYQLTVDILVDGVSKTAQFEFAVK